MKIKRFIMAAAAMLCFAAASDAQIVFHKKIQEPTGQPVPAGVPKLVTVQDEGDMHVQGLAIDKERGFMYFSFTSVFYKTDLEGKIIGSIDNIQGHLGAMTYNPKDHKVYATLECKDDEIGRGIAGKLGVPTVEKSVFYVAVIDVDMIDRPGINPEKNPVMKTVCITDACDDYAAEVSNSAAAKKSKGSKDGGKSDATVLKHRYGCSGIDGIAVGPAVGSDPGDKCNCLYVAYGIYGDKDRKDNDYQVLLCYDIKKLASKARPVEFGKLHTSGPSKADKKYFVRTGNTTYGVQNLAYDPYLHLMFMAVYRGSKPEFPNYSLFAVDMHRKSFRAPLEGVKYQEKEVRQLHLSDGGIRDRKSATRGWNFKWGSTGMCPVGGGYYIFSENYKVQGTSVQGCHARLYSWTGDKDMPFAPVK